MRCAPRWPNTPTCCGKALWESLTSTERNADKFIERDAYMSFETDPAIYDVVRMAYEVAGIALDD